MNAIWRRWHGMVAVGIALLMGMGAGTAEAAAIVKGNDAGALYLGTSWVGGTAPGSSDTAVWNSTITTSRAPALGDNLSVAGISFQNPGGASHSIAATAGKVLTIGASGLDASTATKNFNIMCDVSLGADSTMAAGASSSYFIIFQGAVSGSAKITKTGAGSLRFTGDASGYSGAIEIGAGILDGDQSGTGDMTGSITFTGNATLRPSAGALVLASGRAITINNGITATISPLNTDTLTINGPIGGAGGLTQSTTGGTLILNGTNTYDGTTALSAGTLIGTWYHGIPTNGNINISATGRWLSRESITNNLGTGRGEVQLANTTGFGAYGADIIVKLENDLDVVWGTTSGFNPGVFVLNPVGATGNIDFQNNLDLSSTTARSINSYAYTGTVSATISGTGMGGLIIAGNSGVIKLAGTNTFNGLTWIQDGTLEVTTLANAGAACSLGQQSGTNAIVQMGSAALTGTLRYSGNNDATIDRTINLRGTTGGGGLEVTGAGNLQWTSDVTAGGAGNNKVFSLGGSSTATNTFYGNLSDNSTANKTILEKTGTGTWVLSGSAKSYTGRTRVADGILKLGKSDLISNSSTVTVSAAAGIFDMQDYDDTVGSLDVIDGVVTGTVGTATLTAVSSNSMAAGDVYIELAGTAGLTKSSAGTATLYYNNTALSGTLDIDGGVMRVYHLSDGANGSGAINLGYTTGAGTLEYAGTADTKLTRAITLVGSTGGGVVNAGGSGTVTISSFANTGGTSTQGKTFTLGGSNTGTNTVSTALTDNTLGGNLSLAKSDAGVWRLTADNTYEGTTTINGGLLQVGVGGTSGTLGTGNTTFSAAGVLVFDRDGTTAYNGTIVTVAGAAVTNRGPGTVTLGGAISGAGTVTETGAGLLVLGTGNTHTGGTYINGGTIRLGNNTALGAAASAKLNFGAASNGKLQLYGFSPTVIELNADSTATIENGAASANVLTVNPAVSTTSTLAALLQDGSAGTVALTKGGAGTLVLSNTGNSYSGDTTVNAAGTLRLGASEVIPHGGGKGNLALTLANAILDLNDYDETVNGLSGAVAGVVTNSAGAATITIGANDASGYSSSAVFRDGGPSGTTLNVTKTGAGAQTLAGVISVAGNVTVDGGTLTLSVANTYSGNSVVNSGTLKQGIATGIPSGAGKGDVSVAAAGTLDMAGFATTINGLSGSGIVTNSGPAGADIFSVGNENDDSTFAGSIRDGGAGLAYIQLTKAGTGRLTLDGTNEYVGLTTVSAGALRITANQGLGSPTVGNTLVSAGGALELVGGITVAESATINSTGISGGGALRNVSGNNIWTGSISNGAAGTRMNADAGTTLTLAPAVGNAIYGTTLALICGGEGNITIDKPVGLTTGALTKDGGGVLRLNSTDTFTTSKADVQAGTLLVNGTLGGTASIYVQSGATLGGGGSTTRAVTNLTGSTLAPGDPLVASGIGTLTMKQLQLDSGSTLKFEITDETTRDQVVVQNNNNTTINGAANSVPIYLYQPGGTTTFDADGDYDLIDYVGSVQGTGVSALYVANKNPSKTYRILESGGWIRISISSATAWNSGDVDDAYWSSGDNWGGSAPAAASELRFGSGIRLSTTNDFTAYSFAGITFTNGSGAFELAGNAIELSANVANDDNDLQTIRLNLTLSGSTPDLGAAAGPITIDGAIGQTGGTYGLNKSGSYLLTLGGTNTFGGAVTVNAGALRVTSAAALGDTSGATTVGSGKALQLAGGITLAAENLILAGTGVSADGALRNISGNNTVSGTNSITAPTRINSDAGTLTFDTTGNALAGTGMALTFGGDGDIVVSDPIATGAAGTLTKDGNGRLTLAAANTYTGLTDIQAGVVRVGNATGLGTVAGNVTVASGAALELDGGITIGAEAATVTGTGVSGAGAVRNISGKNTYGGLITLGTGGARINADGGSVLVLNGVVTAAGNDLYVGGAGFVTNLVAAISGGGSLIKDGSGTLAMSFASTYSGSTIVSNGTLAIAVANVMPDGGSAGNVTIMAGATLDVMTADTINGLSGGGIVDNSTATARLLTVGNNDQGSTFAGTIKNTGGAISLQLTKTGAGTLILTGTNTWGGATIISAGGTLQIGDGHNYGTLGTGAVTDSGTLTFNRSDAYSVDMIVSGGGAVIQNGAGTLTLNNAMTFTGALTVNAGTVKNAAAERIANTVPLIVNNGAAFDINAANETLGAITLNNGVLQSAGGQGGGNLYTLCVTSYVGTVNTKIFDRSTLTSFSKLGSGTVTLNRTGNNYNGKTIVEEGTLEFVKIAMVGAGNSSALGEPPNATKGTIELGNGANNATLKFIGDAGVGDVASDRVINLAGTTGNVALDASGVGTWFMSSAFTATGAGAKTLTLTGSNTGTNTLAGAVVDGSGTTALTKAGAGKWVLTGVNNYSGATTVDDGRLMVFGSTAAGSAVAVNSGGILGGTGTLHGTVTANAGGTLAPGASIGDLNVGSLDLKTGSTNIFEFSFSANDHILVADNNGLTIEGGGLYLYEEGTTTAWTNSGVYNLIQYSGTLNGSEQNLTVLNQAGGKTYDFDVSGGWVRLIITSGNPLLSVNDVTVGEGDSGTTNVIFTVSVLPAPSSAITAEFSAVDGTAKSALGDYLATNATFTILTGISSTQIVVRVSGDTMLETNETFTVAISNAVNAEVVDGTGIGAITNDDGFAGVWYADDSQVSGNNNGYNWQDAFTNLQSGASSATSGDEIWVAGGTYKGTSTNAFVRLVAGVEMYGGFAGTETLRSERVDPTANPSIISGDLDNNNANTVTLDAPKLVGIVGANVVVDGFVFEYAIANESYGANASENGAGCIRINANGPITIRNNIFRKCRGDYGINIVSFGSYSGDVVIENCLFHDNTFYDGGSVCGYLRGGHNVYLRNSTSFGNDVPAEGAWQARTGVVYLENTIMDEETAETGSDATPSYWSSGFKKNGASVYAYNCALTSSWTSVSVSDGNAGNVYLTGTSPGFVDAAGDDYRLTASSPCLNAGDNARDAATDIRGVSRPQATTSDIGAYEMNPFATVQLKTAPVTDLRVALDGDEQTAPYQWTTEGSISIAADTPQTNLAGNTRYVFSQWTNDLPVNVKTDNPYTFAASASTNWTAVFTTQYLVTNSIAGSGTLAMSPANGWVASGGTITYSNPQPDVNFTFNHWEDEYGSPLGSADPLLVTVTCPTNIYAVFVGAGESVTIQTSPANAGFMADGDTWYGSHTYSWTDATTHYLAVTSPVQATASSKYVFSSWNDNDVTGPVGTTNWSFDVYPGPITITATFDTYYKLTASGANGTVTNLPASGDGYYAAGASVGLYATPSAGYAFDYWSGDAGGSDNPLAVTMSGAKSITANFKRIYFVDKDATGAGNGLGWADAYTTIGAALTAAAAGAEVWVAEGSYLTPTTSSALTLEAGDTLYGGFAGTESQRTQRNPQLYVTTITGDTNNDGTSDMAGSCALMTSTGANTSYATVDGFTFRYGKFTSGAGYGGAITRPVNGSAFVIKNSVFRDNTALYGGAIGISSATQSTIENCLFFGNTCSGGSYGGAIYVRRGDPLLVMNSTFFGNTASGGAVDDIFRHVSANMTVQNSILWSANPIDGAQAPTITYSDVRGGASGTGNISSDPKFVNESTYDLRLQQGSLALDAGSSAGAPTTDIRGNTRPQGSGPDMGAYEMAAFSSATMTASPAGGQTISVGGVPKIVPNTYTVEVGSVEMTLSPTQTFSTTRYVFQYWTNALSKAGSSANPYSYTATAAATNWQAVFVKQYQVGVSTNPLAGAGTATVADWIDDGASTAFSATPSGGNWGFLHWVETTGGSVVSTANPYSPVITCSTNLTAVFQCTGSSILIQSAPAGATISVEGTDISTPQTFCYLASSAHPLSADDVFAEGTTNEYRFTGWSDTQAQSEPTTNWTYTVPGVDATATANYDTYYKLTVAFGTGGTVSTNPVVADRFHLSGTSVELTAIPDTGYVLAGWSGDASGTANPLTVSMTKAKSITATFRRIYFVDKDAVGANNGLGWANAYVSLATAITAAPDGSEFWVAAGSYNSGADTSMILGPGDAVYGGFAGTESARTSRNWVTNPTIITGDRTGDNVSDMSTAYLLKSSGANSATAVTVDGFTLEYGRLTGASYGAAIRTDNTAGFNINHCIFRNNSSGNFGAAVGLNYGNNTIQNSLFYNNTTTGGSGGAIYLRRMTLSVMNCTFYNNSAPTIADVARDAGAGTFTLRNSILWSSTDPLTSGLDAQYSNVRQASGTYSGTGNINSNPFFSNSSSGDYRLLSGSPSLDTGTSTGAPADDLRGNARPTDEDGDAILEYDMGAYEGAVISATITLATAPSGLSVVADSVTNTAPYVIAWESNTVHDISAALTQEVAGVRYLFQSWSDGGAATHSLTATQSETITATYLRTQAQWTVSVNLAEAGSVSPASALYDYGSFFYATATPYAGWTFTNWSGTLSGYGTSLAVDMTQGVTVVANFVLTQPVIYVNDNASGLNNGTSWANALTNLQTALTAAVGNQEIWVAAGTYRPGSSAASTFSLRGSLPLYGGFAGTETARSQRAPEANASVLSGDVNLNDTANYGNRADNVATVVTITNANTTLDGFVVSGGYKTGTGAGVLISGGVSPTIANCVFTGNRASISGGGMAITGGSATITNSVFSDNYAASYGGGAFVDAAAPIFDRCVFTGGHVTDNGGALFFQGNGGSAQVRNCLFAGNYSVLYAGAIRCDGPSSGVVYYPTPSVINCTFSGNRADQYDGAIFVKRLSSLSLTNCISWGNSAGLGTSEIGTQNGGVVMAGYSDIAGGWAGGTAISNANPSFVADVGGTWLSVGSYDAVTRTTTLTANGSPGWTVDDLVGLTVNPDTSQYRQFAIKSNGANTLVVWGDATQVAANGEPFAVKDYELSGITSPCYNNGTSGGAPLYDLLTITRPNAGAFDMGAYEYLTPIDFTGSLFLFQ